MQPLARGMKVLLCLLIWASFGFPLSSQQTTERGLDWRGVLRSSGGAAVSGATVEILEKGHTLTAITQPDGVFVFHDLKPHRYALSVMVEGHRVSYAPSVDLTSASRAVILTVTQQRTLRQ